ncbi:hypothetical protein [Pseudoramibacter alactolyticus]|uniref:hypothetical protein n=1 Tax=Pseudoramibacter alactolyticus TaxID=113287 RepID=UPI00248DD44C|nr:hypothetical protein [Pseudoramibacter alactolyticus]
MIDNYEKVQAVFAERFSEIEDMIAKKHHRTGELRNICLKFGVSADYLLGLSNCKGIRR